MAHILEWHFVIRTLSQLRVRFQLLGAGRNNCEVTLVLFLEPKNRSSEKLALYLGCRLIYKNVVATPLPATHVHKLHPGMISQVLLQKPA